MRVTASIRTKLAGLVGAEAIMGFNGEEDPFLKNQISYCANTRQI
jgi:hypothetical protein